MQECVESFLRFMLDCFSKGRFRDFANRVAVPMVIYAEEPPILVARGREEAALYLAAGWLDLRCRVHRFEPEIVCIGSVRNGEFAVRVDWHSRDRDGRSLGTSRVRYVLGRDDQGRLRLEMTEVFGPSWVRPIELAAPKRPH